MTVTKDQAQMLATLAAASRPNGARRWDHAGIMAALAKVADRGLAEVIMATIRAAADRDCETPGVIPSPGSHWAESASVRTFVPDVAPTRTRCTACGKQARNHPGSDHAFIHPREHDFDDWRGRVAELRAELAPTSGPTERRTLDDLAEANPELHARIETLRTANPGLQAPPMREEETT